jgi:glycosyltransferase involved in cell wall biosynthesis
LNTAPRHRLLVDVTQYVSWPATSGVQRVLWHLAHNWPGMRVEASYGFLERRRYVVGPVAHLGRVIRSTFRERAQLDVQRRAAAVRQALRDGATASVASDDVETHFGAFMLPELSFHEESIAVADRLLSSRRPMVFFVYYDALPLTHPQFFRLDVERELPLMRYNGTVARSENVAFISSSIRKVFETRVARRALRNAVVTPLGADGLVAVPPEPPATPTFTVLGTIEPRKRYPMVLDAFERLWLEGHDYRLTVIGSPATDAGTVARLRHHAERARLTWLEQADDDDIATVLSQSSAMLFISDAEGYGLPPLEAMAVGCPVIVSAKLPALDALPSAGQVRLEEPNVETLVAAVQDLADPASNAAHRARLKELTLPTWEAYAARVEKWVASVLEDDREGNSDG